MFKGCLVIHRNLIWYAVFLIKENNIINISYNYLNLPEKIDKEGGTRLEYLYDAAGNKLRQLEYKEGILKKTTDFVANFVFTNGKPAWYNFDEGRVVYKSEANYYAESYLKDLTSTPLSTGLGSVRVAFGFENGIYSVRQVNSYYPFGMNIKGLTANSVTTKTAYPNEYLYNGKLMQDEMGLGWLDYGRRMYDLQLGRWHSVDPLAEEYRKWSPYNYAIDNPYRIIDPDGMGPWDIVKGTGIVAGGVVQWVGGVALISSGAGAPAGLFLIMSGSSSIGFGAAVIVNNGKKDIPTGMGQAMGRGYDIGTKSDNKTGEKVGAVVDWSTSLPAGPYINTTISVISGVSNVLGIAGTVETIMKPSAFNEQNTAWKIKVKNNSANSDYGIKGAGYMEDNKNQSLSPQSEHPLMPQTLKRKVESWLEYR